MSNTLFTKVDYALGSLIDAIGNGQIGLPASDNDDVADLLAEVPGQLNRSRRRNELLPRMLAEQHGLAATSTPAPILPYGAAKNELTGGSSWGQERPPAGRCAEPKRRDS